MEKELGHPILASTTMGRLLPEADCPLTVGLCERPLHSLSHYTASLRHKKGAWLHVGDAKGVGAGGGRNYYSMTHIEASEGARTSAVVGYVVMAMDRCAVKIRLF